jgi:hypothetical protein
MLNLFVNINDNKKFAGDLERLLSDKLSYYDLNAYKKDSDYKIESEEDKEELEAKLNEWIYHVFLLGLLSGFDYGEGKRPISNRESGDGRYDIYVEKERHNIIFEFKSCKNYDELETKANEALGQIDAKRYGADIDNNKLLLKVGIAFCKKRCKVKCC